MGHFLMFQKRSWQCLKLCSNSPRYQSLVKDLNMTSNISQILPRWNYLSYFVIFIWEFNTPDHITNNCSFSNHFVLQSVIFLVRQSIMKLGIRAWETYLVVCVCWAIETTAIAAGTEGRLKRERCSEICRLWRIRETNDQFAQSY